MNQADYIKKTYEKFTALANSPNIEDAVLETFKDLGQADLIGEFSTEELRGLNKFFDLVEITRASNTAIQELGN